MSKSTIWLCQHYIYAGGWKWQYITDVIKPKQVGIVHQCWPRKWGNFEFTIHWNLTCRRYVIYLQMSKDQSFVIPIFLYRGRFEKETRFQSHSRSHNQKQHYKSETAVSARHQRLSKRLKTSYIPRRSLQFSGTSNRLEMFHLSLFCVSIPQCISWYNTHRYYSKLNLAKLSKSECH